MEENNLNLPVLHGRMLPSPSGKNYTLGAQVVRNIPEGYAVIEMYKSRNSFDPNHPVFTSTKSIIGLLKLVTNLQAV